MIKLGWKKLGRIRMWGGCAPPKMWHCATTLGKLVQAVYLAFDWFKWLLTFSDFVMHFCSCNFDVFIAALQIYALCDLWYNTMDGWIDGLTDWVNNWSIDWLIGRLTDWLIGRLTDWLIDCHAVGTVRGLCSFGAGDVTRSGRSYYWEGASASYSPRGVGLITCWQQTDRKFGSGRLRSAGWQCRCVAAGIRQISITIWFDNTWFCCIVLEYARHAFTVAGSFCL